MADHGPKFEGEIDQEEFDQKKEALRVMYAKGGKKYKDYIEKCERWAEGEGENDMECAGEFPDWSMKDLRRLLDAHYEEVESGDAEQWES